MKTIYKIICIFMVVLISGISFAQHKDNNNLNYPEGLYVSFEDFNSKNAQGSFGDYSIKEGGDSVSYRFTDIKTDKKLKKEFALSDGKDLYVSMRGIIKNLEKDDKSQAPDQINYYLKALSIGNRYIYFEDHFTSSGAALWGGAIATAAARRVKGVIYDSKTKSFNLFKNAEDFESFISSNHPEYQAKLDQAIAGQKRKKKVEDLDLIREIIFEINKA